MEQNTLRWILPTLLCATATKVMAVEPYDPSPFSGFYVGGALGGSFKSAKEHNVTLASNDISIPPPIVIPPPPDIPPNNSTNVFGHSLSGAHKKNRPAAGLYAGYGYVCGETYWGLEAFLNSSGYKTRSTKNLALQQNILNSINPITTPSVFITLTDAVETRSKLKCYESGLDFRPGLFLTPCTLLYGRIGAGYNKLSLTTRLNDNFVQNAVRTGLVTTSAISSSALSAQKDKRIGTFRLGMGLEQNICENFTIRADYVNTNYRNIQLRRAYTVTNAIGETATFINQIKISRFFNNSVTLGASYYW